MTNILTLPNMCSQLAFRIAEKFKMEFGESYYLHEISQSKLPLYLVQGMKEIGPYQTDEDATISPGCIIPVKKGRLVASIDSSCTLLGLSGSDLIYATRLTAVFSYSGEPNFFVRIGPIIIKLRNNGIDDELAESELRKEIEYMAIGSILSSEFDGILLIDGSLENFAKALNHNPSPDILGISKSSFLSLREPHLSCILSKKYPCCIKVFDDNYNTYLAKLQSDGVVFRIDIQSKKDAQQVLGELIFNDCLYAGYPESLRLSHHLSVFNKSEIVALKALLQREFKVVNTPSYNVRKIVLGSLVFKEK